METDDASRRAPWRPPAIDVVVALAIAAAEIAGAAFAGQFHPGERRSFDALAVGLLLAGALVLVVRRRYPVGTFVATATATFVYLFLDYSGGPIWFAMILAFGTMVMAGRRTEALTALAGGYFAFAWLPMLLGREDALAPAEAVALAAWLLVLFSAAEVLRARRDRAEAATRSREEEGLRRITEERLRIARELHDVVAHNISMINLQAGVALHLIDEQPDQARTALAAIKEASKEALVELRSVLGVLRRVDEAAPRAPAPGLARLPDLVAQATAARLAVELTVVGNPRPLPPGLDLVAFRIVQEALTNVSRHAGPASAAVRVTYEPRHLDLEVVDDGHGVGGTGSLPGSGNGIAGMRERAEAAGGSFEAGPLPGVGWRVHARLPLPDDAGDVDSTSAGGGTTPTDRDATAPVGGNDSAASTGGTARPGDPGDAGPTGGPGGTARPGGTASGPGATDGTGGAREPAESGTGAPAHDGGARQ